MSDAEEPAATQDAVPVEAKSASEPGGFLTAAMGLSQVLFVLAVLGGLMAISTPKFSAARGRANIRACYANQKTIAGAIEMYCLDFNTQITSLEGMGDQLMKHGYLQSVPRDPGEGQAPMVNYVLKVRGEPCKIHPQRPDESCEPCRKGPVTWVECQKHGAFQARSEP